ncbi:hypothetical protein PanWU01x14_002590 [Parasponia andersonii]|uniref:Uncharacterized protein n=1 Tax=Parasponia andersonii TaxID=3476 RepID=A0A2P5E583_PARAD|nr:hypothetical protein PanWU01x14_002590 [Parasponia andersonii]
MRVPDPGMPPLWFRFGSLERERDRLLLEEEDYWRHGSRTTWRSLLPCNLMMDGLETCTVFSREFREILTSMQPLVESFECDE